MSLNINDLKKNLGPGLGLRKNKYLIEIPIPDGRQINILCRSTGLPERNIQTTTVFHKGRKYNVRGETDYVGTYDISILDDSDMKLRQMFDKWCERVDDSKLPNSGILGASFEDLAPGLLENIKDGIDLANNVKNAIENPSVAADFFIGLLENGGAMASYQTDINIWQLSNTGEKVYGYKITNAFPSQVGIVTLDDGDENTLSEFNVQFTFSEFQPLKGFGRDLAETLLGDTGTGILNGVEALFE